MSRFILFYESKLKANKYMSAKRLVTFSQTFVKQSGQGMHIYVKIKMFRLLYQGKYL